METIELKSNLHKIIDQIQNEQLLQSLYDFLKENDSSKTGHSWNTMTVEQKQEVLLAYKESEDENNLIARENIFYRPK